MAQAAEAITMDERDDERVYTAEDYWNLPDDRRAELIDGKLYDMTPPARVHQQISMALSVELSLFVRSHDGACKVFAAPFAVNLDANEKTWVEPDVVVICDPAKLSERGCEGAPDLVIEIASPSTRRRDYILKTGRYEHAGVREYWIVDPEFEQTMVCCFEKDPAAPHFYPFAEPVPVGIWGGALVITVADLLE